MSNLLIVSAIVSLLVTAIKHYAGTEGMKSVAVSIAVSLVAGAGYFFLYQTAYWETCLQILAFASMIYGVIIKQVQEQLK